MSESKHSPLPWTQHAFLIKSKHGDFVTHCGMGNLPPSRSSESEANAAFIVRAVNSHEALVDALKRARDWMKEPMGGHLLHERFDGKTECESDCLRCAVNAAISLA